MKRIIIFILISFSTLITLSQTPNYTRGYEMYIGKTGSDKSTWKDNPISINLLIKVEQNKVTIYSNTTQTYYTIKLLYENNQGTTKWYCNDSNGESCYLTIGPLNIEKCTFFQIEYSDYTWVYFCKSE